MLLNLISGLAILLTGYSVFAGVQIFLLHVSGVGYQVPAFSRLMALLLLLALVCLQGLHFAYLQQYFDGLDSHLYTLLLFIVAPAFYLFSRPVLLAEQHGTYRRLLHFLPTVFAPFFVSQWALPLAFAIGAGYLLWLFYRIYCLRRQRNQFYIEAWLLSIVIAIALAVTLLGLGLFDLSRPYFIALYSIAIGMALFLVNTALAFRPSLPNDVIEIARETYAVSTLSQVDCEGKLQQLNQLMQDQQLYQHASLDLPSLAKQLNLTNHQLSELINSHLGKGFSRYLREYRVQAAQAMLLSESNASVLSVGLSVGFTSQSNFYAAFKEIVGNTPGQYRQINQIINQRK